MRPVIGITTRPRVIPSSSGDADAHTLLHTYSDSVLRAGGIPVLLAPVPVQDVVALLERIDGLVLSGGGDIDPARYGGSADDTMYGIDFDRDEFELSLVAPAAAMHLPVLAICRGQQVVNVALGGNLIEDIPGETGSMDHSVIGLHVFDGHQRVTLESGCRIAAAVGRTELKVNSIHHQAVRLLAPGLRAVGWADDGVIEAIEAEDPDWPLLAVQWHPEYLNEADDDASLALFRTLVDGATAHRTR